jgi:hypothetical protein
MERAQQALQDKTAVAKEELCGLQNQLLVLQQRCKDQGVAQDIFGRTGAALGGTVGVTGGFTGGVTGGVTGIGFGGPTSNEQSNEARVMHYAVMRGQLAEKIRQQKEQMEQLQLELEKMRLRTFPTFVKPPHAHTARL